MSRQDGRAKLKGRSGSKNQLPSWNHDDRHILLVAVVLN